MSGRMRMRMRMMRGCGDVRCGCAHVWRFSVWARGWVRGRARARAWVLGYALARALLSSLCVASRKRSRSLSAHACRNTAQTACGDGWRGGAQHAGGCMYTAATAGGYVHADRRRQRQRPVWHGAAAAAARQMRRASGAAALAVAHARSPRMRRASCRSFGTARRNAAHTRASTRQQRTHTTGAHNTHTRQGPTTKRLLACARTDGDALGVDGAQVGVLEQAHQVRLGRLLQRKDGEGLEAEVGGERLRNLAHEALEGQLADEQVGALLELADLAQRHRAGAVAVRLREGGKGRWREVCCARKRKTRARCGRCACLFDAAGGGRGLARRLGGQLLARRLAAGGLAAERREAAAQERAKRDGSVSTGRRRPRQSRRQLRPRREARAAPA
jgi:hypothetical protein